MNGYYQAGPGLRRVWLLKSSVLAVLYSFMLRQGTKESLLLFFLLIFPYGASAAVIEQLIAVVNGEPYTLSNLTAYAKSKMNRAFPSGDLNQINASDREVLEQFITDKLHGRWR